VARTKDSRSTYRLEQSKRIITVENYWRGNILDVHNGNYLYVHLESE
jgi:hypothetical protein